jgi:uncharacterized RDD family membrane protein YckC
MVTVPPTTAMKETMSTPMENYASLKRRWAAVFIDGIILTVVNSLISLPLFVLDTTTRDSINLVGVVGIGITGIQWLIGVVYPIFFIGRTGQTLGKKAMGIKVVKLETMDHPTYFDAFLREVVGKFVSSIVLGLGYLWAIRDSRKQTWHDKIAKTVVIKI